jgi:hypothetical protein
VRDDGFAYDALTFRQANYPIVRRASDVGIIVKRKHNAQLWRTRADGFASNAHGGSIDRGKDVREREVDHECCTLEGWRRRRLERGGGAGVEDPVLAGRSDQ